MIETLDFKITVFLDGENISSITRISMVTLIEDKDSILPYGFMTIQDMENYFGSIQLVGGETLRIEITDKVSEEIESSTFRVLFVDRLNDQTLNIHFVLNKQGMLGAKKSRSFSKKPLSEVINQIIRNDLREPIFKTNIAIAYPTTTWVQPYMTNAEFINYLKTKAYYSDFYNFYAFYSLDSSFTFKSYQEAVTYPSVYSYDLSDVIINNKKYYSAYRNFPTKGYYYDIDLNSFVETNVYSQPKKEASKYSMRREDENLSPHSVIHWGSTNNFRDLDLTARMYHLDREIISLRYGFPKSHSFFLKLLDPVDLNIKSKLLAVYSSDIAMDNFNSGKWIIGKIERQYSSSGLINYITFNRKGIDKAENKIKNKNKGSGKLGSLTNV